MPSVASSKEGVDQRQVRKWVAPVVVFYQFQFSFFAGVFGSVFHAENAFVSFVIQMLENIFIVHLAGGGLFPAGIIADLEISGSDPSSSQYAG